MTTPDNSQFLPLGDVVQKEISSIGEPALRWYERSTVNDGGAKQLNEVLNMSVDLAIKSGNPDLVFTAIDHITRAAAIAEYVRDEGIIDRENLSTEEPLFFQEGRIVRVNVVDRGIDHWVELDLAAEGDTDADTKKLQEQLRASGIRELEGVKVWRSERDVTVTRQVGVHESGYPVSGNNYIGEGQFAFVLGEIGERTETSGYISPENWMDDPQSSTTETLSGYDAVLKMNAKGVLATIPKDRVTRDVIMESNQEWSLSSLILRSGTSIQEVQEWVISLVKSE